MGRLIRHLTLSLALAAHASAVPQTLYVGSLYGPVFRVDDLAGQPHPVYIPGPEPSNELAIDPFTGDLFSFYGHSLGRFRGSPTAIEVQNIGVTATVRAADFDARGDLWFRVGSPETLRRLDRATGQIVIVSTAPARARGNLAVGTDGRIFTANEAGEIDVFDPVTGVWSSLGPHGFGNEVKGFEIDSNGVGYVALANRSLYRLDLATMTSQLIVDLATFQVAEFHGLALAEPATTGYMWGTGYCTPGSLNSTNAHARIAASGSGLAQANMLALHVTQAPSGAAGFFLVSRTQGFIPHVAWSQGNLCLGGGIGRFVGPGQILTSTPVGFQGRFDFAVDLSAIPTPAGFVTGLPGDTWNFQLWYRDANSSGASLSNFSDALSIVLR